MKTLKKYYFLALLLIVPLTTLAQGQFEITPFGGYMFGGKFRFYEGELKIQDAGNYGALVDIEIATDTKIELLWSQMQTSARFKPYYGYDYISSDPFNLTLNYFQIGGVREADYDNIRPFGALTFGAAYFKPTSMGLPDNWQFAVTLGGGVKIWITEQIGIRLQGRLMLPMYFAGVGAYFGTGGSGLTVGASSSVVQGDFTGGLIFSFGE